MFGLDVQSSQLLVFKNPVILKIKIFAHVIVSRCQIYYLYKHMKSICKIIEMVFEKLVV